MRISTSILLFFFSLSLLSRSDLLSFIKKIKSPLELSTSEDYDESESADPDQNQNKKSTDAKEELDEKHTHFITFNSGFIFFKDFRYTKHFLDHSQQLFKSHFKEVVCPPPEFIV